MLARPTMKRDLAISKAVPQVRLIYLWATRLQTEWLREYGELKPVPEAPGKYALWVDARFDFEEVLRYVEALSEASRKEEA